MTEHDDLLQAVIPLSKAEQLNEARSVVRQEAETLQRLAASLDFSFCEAVDLIRGRDGRVVVTGVGKAGLIGQKIVATLASTGTPAHFLHPTEAVHGDLGAVTEKDTVLALSNSGESEEITRLIPAIRRLGAAVIAVTASETNSLSSLADVTLKLGVNPEAGILQLAPTSSAVAMLAVGDALALVLSRLRGFTAQDFARFHPAGSLGQKLRPVSEVMRSGDQLRIARTDQCVRSVMVDLSHPGRRTGAVIVVDEQGRLAGLFTDSDLVRLFEQRKDGQIDRPIHEVMTSRPKTTRPDVLLPEAIHIMAHRKLSELPVIDSDGFPVGLLDITDVLDCSSQQQVFSDSPASDHPVPETLKLKRSA